MVTNLQEQITSGLLVALGSYVLSPYQSAQSSVLSRDHLT